MISQIPLTAQEKHHCKNLSFFFFFFPKYIFQDLSGELWLFYLRKRLTVLGREFLVLRKSLALMLAGRKWTTKRQRFLDSALLKHWWVNQAVFHLTLHFGVDCTEAVNIKIFCLVFHVFWQIADFLSLNKCTHYLKFRIPHIPLS